MLNKDSWICKDNRLVNASYKLNVGELKLILAISSMVNPLDKEFKDYTISIKDFARLLGINLSTNKNFYSRVKRASGLLLSKRVTIHEKDGDFQTVWLSGIKYFDNEGKVAVSFHPKLIKYYLQLQEYTKYRLINITDLKSEYSLKLYEVLKQFEKIGERTYKIEELKKFLGVENEYDRFYDFKRRILLVTQKEINEKTDISFEFEELKEGRSIKALKFYIHAKKSLDKKKPNVAASEISATTEPEEDSSAKKVMAIMSEHNITALEAKKIYDSSKGNLDIIKKIYHDKKDTVTRGGIVGLMISLVKPGVYMEPKKKISEISFTNYEQRAYDFDKLEKKLLGWDK